MCETLAQEWDRLLQRLPWPPNARVESEPAQCHIEFGERGKLLELGGSDDMSELEVLVLILPETLAIKISADWLVVHHSPG
jgi:hypothetical protein